MNRQNEERMPTKFLGEETLPAFIPNTLAEPRARRWRMRGERNPFIHRLLILRVHSCKKPSPGPDQQTQAIMLRCCKSSLAETHGD